MATYHTFKVGDKVKFTQAWFDLDAHSNLKGEYEIKQVDDLKYSAGVGHTQWIYIAEHTCYNDPTKMSPFSGIWLVGAIDNPDDGIKLPHLPRDPKEDEYYVGEY